MTPVLSLHILRHPDSVEAAGLADALHRHFISRPLLHTGDGAEGVVVRDGLPSLPADGGSRGDDAATLVLVLMDAALAADKGVIGRLDRLRDRAGQQQHRLRIIGVSLYEDAYRASARLAAGNFLRLHTLPANPQARAEWLVREVVLCACRLLAALLARQAQPGADDAAPNAAYEARLSLFLSHSKHDGQGEGIAKALRADLHDQPGFDSFFDLHDIPAGVDFGETIEREAGRSVLLAVVTDSYADREWCRREVLAARRTATPLVVVDALTGRAGRLLPWLGNTPALRLESGGEAALLPLLLDTVLDQVLRHRLWLALTHRHRSQAPAPSVPLRFTWRQPDLLDLFTPLAGPGAAAQPPAGLLVHPGLPVPAEERAVHRQAAPKLTVLAYASWLAQRQRPDVSMGDPADRTEAPPMPLPSPNGPHLHSHFIALSVSDPAPEDLAARGLTPRHLSDALELLAGHLLAQGAALIYGGDPRRGGFTEALTTLVARYARDGRTAVGLVENPLAFPVHIKMPWEELEDRARELAPATRQVLLTPDATGELSLEARRGLITKPPSDQEQAEGLTAMRRRVAGRASALIVLGGKLSGYSGRMPGIVEEVLCAVEAGRPVYLLGGFGGATAALCGALGLLDGAPALPGDVPAEMRGWTAEGTLRNGLTRADNETLAQSTNPTELAARVLRGLEKRLGQPG